MTFDPNSPNQPPYQAGAPMPPPGPPQAGPPQAGPPQAGPPQAGPPPPVGPTAAAESQAGPAHGIDERGKVKRGKVSAIWIGLIVAALLLVALLIFIAQNSKTVAIHFLGFSGHLSLAVAILAAAVIGVLVVAIPGTARIIQLRRALKKNTSGTQTLES